MATGYKSRRGNPNHDGIFRRVSPVTIPDGLPAQAAVFCGGLGTAGEGVKRAVKLVAKAQA